MYVTIVQNWVHLGGVKVEFLALLGGVGMGMRRDGAKLWEERSTRWLPYPYTNWNTLISATMVAAQFQKTLSAISKRVNSYASLDSSKHW